MNLKLGFDGRIVSNMTQQMSSPALIIVNSRGMLILCSFSDDLYLTIYVMVPLGVSIKIFMNFCTQNDLKVTL